MIVRLAIPAGAGTLAFALFATHAQAQALCNLPATVGGGVDETALGVPARSSRTSPIPGIGWGVGDGQCNGSFVSTVDSGFPSPDGDGIELAIRAEQRRVGQVDPVGGDYTVETGEDQPNRAWWNFQTSTAYDGNINDLDGLVFDIRTDAGPNQPLFPSYDMLLLRSAIDDRNDTSDRPAPADNPTATYTDLYQTSQNPEFFPWFAAFDEDAEGAWTMTLAALEDGALASVQVCIHTPNAACAAEAPIVYSCEGFGPPLDDPLSLKKAKRTLPLKIVCRDGDGAVLSDDDIAGPTVVLTRLEGGDATTDGELDNRGIGDGDAFEWDEDDQQWRYNLSTRNFNAPGTFEISIEGSGDDVLVGSPMQTVTIGN